MRSCLYLRRTDTFFEQTKVRPKDTLEFNLTKSVDSALQNLPLEI